MNKKKVLAIAVAVCLIAILSFSTLAWFTDTDQATNTFTVGSIKVVQHEKQPVVDENGDPTGELEDFEQDQVMLPVVDPQNPEEDPNYIYKMVSVENTGKNSAYVRTSIAVPTALLDYLHLDTNEVKWHYEFTSSVTVDGMAYTVFSYYYEEAVEKDGQTELLLEGVYLDSTVDVKTNPATNNLEFCKANASGGYDFSGFAVQDAEGTTYKVNVLVATQAVQAEGFANAQEALNGAFGTNPPAFGA